MCWLVRSAFPWRLVLTAVISNSGSAPQGGNMDIAPPAVAHTCPNNANTDSLCRHNDFRSFALRSLHDLLCWTTAQDGPKALRGDRNSRASVTASATLP